MALLSSREGRLNSIPSRFPYSLGCYACRRMKVKCDEEKPQCRRCTKAGRVCPGYRDVSQVVFRSMNAELSSKAETSYSSRTHAAIATPDHAGEVSAAPISLAPRLLIQPSENWEMKATSHFLHNYSFAPTKDAPGYLEFLPDLLRRNSNSRHLKSAVLAAGLASLANITSLGHLEHIAKKRYGETLKSISMALRDPIEARSDAVLAAVFLLQLCETISGTTSAQPDPHDKALEELLRLRRNDQPTEATCKDLLIVVHRRLQIASVIGLYSSKLNTEYNVGTLGLQPHQVELWRLMCETSQSCGKIRTMLSIPGERRFKSEIIKSIDQALSAYLSLLRWKETLPSGWMYRSCKTLARNDDDSYKETFPKMYHLFKHVHHAAVWIGFWTISMFVLQTLIHVLSLPSVNQIFTKEWHRSWDLRKRLRGVVDDICAAAPHMMADVDDLGLPTVGYGKALGSYFLLPGLYVANRVDELTSTQRHYILKTLQRIAHLRGIKQALRT
ncbi:hypothetical protein HD806DRAFT_552992 [Xylariaceae sp. AK1471]|nr:hypothetical protein HD806DRAFT_552992 [Xylariaceae sp. AK1471]